MTIEDLKLTTQNFFLERDRYCAQQIVKPLLCEFPDDFLRKINFGTSTYTITSSGVSGSANGTTTTTTL